jgi:hypothetical protein
MRQLDKVDAAVQGCGERELRWAPPRIVPKWVQEGLARHLSRRGCVEPQPPNSSREKGSLSSHRTSRAAATQLWVRLVKQAQPNLRSHDINCECRIYTKRKSAYPIAVIRTDKAVDFVPTSVAESNGFVRKDVNSGALDTRVLCFW